MNRMIYTLTVKCMEGAYKGVECVRIIEIVESSLLHDLHLIIQDVTGFDNKHSYDFYGGRYPGHKDLLIGKDKYVHFMPDSFSYIRLNEVYPLPSGLKLYYLFDFDDSWIFQITKSRQLKEEMLGVYYPREIPGRFGPNPTQYRNTR